MPEVLHPLSGDAAKRTWWIPHNFVIDGEIKVPTGQADIIPTMYVAVAAGQTLKLARLRYNIEGGTSVTFKIQQNGVDIPGLTGLSATPAGTPTNVDPTDVVLADLDSLQVIVTAVSGLPTNMTVMLTLEYSV